MKNLLFFLVLCYLPFTACTQEYEGVSKKGEVVVLGPNFNFEEYVKHDVEKKIEQWQKKGEFETTDEWKKRVTEENRNAKATEFYKNALDDLKKKYAATLDWSKLKIGKYDADHETFLISHPDLGQFTMHVSIDSARYFKDNFYKFKIAGADFALVNNKFLLAQLTFFDSVSPKYFHYDSKLSTMYVQQQIDYNFPPIDINVTLPQQAYQKNDNISKQNLRVGNDPVDVNIPTTTLKSTNTYALIIGNQKYRFEQDVPFALNDAKTFKRYLVKTLGITDNNIKYVENATLGIMNHDISWISNIIKTYGPEVNILIYYAGHGFPDLKNKNAYLMPADGAVEDPGSAIDLNEFYTALNKYPSNQIILFLDACFSGASRDGMLADARGVAIKPKETGLEGNMIVFSAATGEQTAFPYDEKKHGLFTYYLLKKLQESKGNVTLGELADYLKTNVMKISVIENDAIQTPEIKTSVNLINNWRSRKLAH